MVKPDETMTVLGRMSRLRGDLECQGDLQIDGAMQGSIRQTGGRVTIGAEAVVMANLIAQDVVVIGKIEGDIRATGRVDLRSTAVVVGDVFAARLSMEENATLHGQVDPSRNSEEPPARQEVVSRPDPSPIESVIPRDPEHRQAVPLREESSSRYSVPQLEPAATERQLPSALAAFAPGGRKDLSDREGTAASSSPVNSWQHRDND